MKKLLLLLLCLYSLVSQSQTILKVKLPGQKKSALPISPEAKKTIDSLNTAIKTFRDTTDSVHFMTMYRHLMTPSLLLVEAVTREKKAIGTPLDTTKYNLSPDSLTAIAKKIDTIPLSGDTPASACPGIKDVTIKFILDANDNYLGVVEDTTGNALESFSILQSNKELFYDKLNKAFTSLCNDTTADTIVAQFKRQDPDLYTQFLEKKEDLANTNGLAGTLKIYKNTYVRYLSSDGGRDHSVTKKASGIENIVQAKKSAEESLTKAQELQAEIDATAKRAGADSSMEDRILVGLITKTASDIDKEVQTATHYYDSVVKQIPGDRILYEYDTVIQLSEKAQIEARKAIKTIRYALKQTRKIAGPYKETETEDLLPILPTIAFSPDTYDSLPTNTPAGTAGIHPPDSNFTIQSIQIQFEDGFIENIKIFGKLKNNAHLLRFENIYPIGFSTKRDFRNLISTQLFEKSDYKTNSTMFLKLGEVLSYDQNLANYNKDYSPANQVVTIKALTDSIKEVVLYKDQTSKILELQVFSDLKGADDNNPNGLIQIDLAKKLNFFSMRSQISGRIWPWHWGIWPTHWHVWNPGWHKSSYENLGNIGLFNYVTPYFTLDKIENNDKRLILDHIDTLSYAADTSKPITYASTIHLLQHQVFSIGFDLSMVLIDIPNIKSTFNFGAGFRFGRTAIQDTLRTRSPGVRPLDFHAADTNNILQYGVNTFQWGPFLTWQLFPDSRFGVSVTQRFTWFKAPTSNFVQVRDSAHFLKYISEGPYGSIRTRPYTYYDYTSSNWFEKNLAKPFSLLTKCIASTEIFAYFSPNSDGGNKLFFRYRFNWDVANAKENFYQLQIGFSTYLSATKEYSKLKKSVNID
ncbi:MAG: hypothetical protein P4L51_10815 [Puia sp.]|nr:hypothetical protein [Puia sp.]